MKRLLIILFISLFINCYNLVCQTTQPVEKWMEYVEGLAEILEDDEQIESLYSDFSYLSEHPLDINTASTEMFKRLSFLSDGQIDALMAYRKRFGNMATLYELKNIEAMDWTTIELLLPFVYVGEANVNRQRSFTPENLFKYGKNELILRYDRTLQKKQGYKSQSDSILEKYPNRKYLGEPFYHSIRYSYTFDDRVQAGFLAEKDAGEPFLNRYHKGYDFYSAHILLKDMGLLRTLTIGDYKASFGQGLLLSHDFMPGRSAFLSQAERRNNGFRRHYSTNEQAFFRGAASTVRWKELDVSLFYSNRKLDATVESAYITTFKTDGMHRVPGDMEKKGVVTAQTYGGNIRYATPNIIVGTTVLAYQYGDLSVAPDPKPYNLYYFRGSRNMNASVDYMLKNNRIKFYGETALSKNGGWATLDALQWTPVSYATGLILYRSYARDYQAFYGNAFSQNSTLQNEQGFYMGMQLSPVANWKLSGYADFFRFPWLKYEVDAPSSGTEYMAQLDYVKRDKFSTYLRYRYRKKES
ncbi:MAG: helix-hairpin-helix domain-containing protein, partial [Tannerella sp.]|nr:helix-hairpin-helix domain-containing protein [Tannerella sp.]